MDIPVIRTAIQNWITATIGSDLAIYWKHRPRGYDQGRIICSVQSAIPMGRDAIHWEYDAGAAVGSELTPHAVGNRTFTLQLRIETYSASDDLDSAFYSASLMDSLSLPSNQAIFSAAGIGYRSVLGNTDLEYIKNEREISTTVLELSFHADADRSGTAIGYVEQWGIESDLDGIPAGKQIDELMP